MKMIIIFVIKFDKKFFLVFANESLSYYYIKIIF